MVKKNKTEMFAVRLEEELAIKLDNILKEIKNKIGYTISKSNFTRVAIQEKIERDSLKEGNKK
jgi:metal-responsive CopG/Arc/MetJ family transcriptional regulator